MAGDCPDYLIVGGGVTGLHLAARLAESGLTVTVVEAGAEMPPSGLDHSRDFLGTLRTPGFDHGHTVALDPRGVSHYSQGRGLGGASNLNGGLWIPPTASDRLALGLPSQPTPPHPAFLPLEASRPQGDPLSRAVAGHLAATGAGEVCAGLVSQAAPYALAGTHRAGFRRSFAGLAARGDGRMGVRAGETVRSLGQDGQGAWLETANGERLRARRGLILAAGALGSLGLLTRGAGLMPRCPPKLTDHLCVRIRLLAPGLSHDPAVARGDWTLTQKYGPDPSGPLATVGGVLGADADAPVVVIGSPTATRWPAFGPGRLLGADYYTVSVMPAYPFSRARVTERSPTDQPFAAHLDFDLDPRDMQTLLAGVAWCRDMVASLPAELRAYRADHPLSLESFLKRRPDADWVRRHIGVMHHPVGTVHQAGLADDQGRVHGMPKLRVIDSSVLRGMPLGTIMPAVVALAEGALPSLVEAEG